MQILQAAPEAWVTFGLMCAIAGGLLGVIVGEIVDDRIAARDAADMAWAEQFIADMRDAEIHADLINDALATVA